MAADRPDEAVFQGSGNVFADLGLPDAEELLVKARLASAITEIIKERRLTQAGAAKVLGSTQPKLSNLMNGRLDGFSLERLARFLNALDRDVEIVVTRRPRSRKHARLTVNLG